MTARRTVAILAFHRVGAPGPDGWESWYYLPGETFAAQLAWLRDNDFEAIELGRLIDGLDDPGSLPERSALLTFDDAHHSVHDVALPLLLHFGYPAVVFVPTDYIGRRSSFDSSEPEEDVCGWDQLRELQRNGVSVQSHTASHRRFSELGFEDQVRELGRSKEVLEDGLGTAVEALAYPYGDAGRQRERLGEALEHAGYLLACGYRGGTARLPDADRYGLTRVAVGPDVDLAGALAGSAQ